MDLIARECMQLVTSPYFLQLLILGVGAKATCNMLRIRASCSVAVHDVPRGQTAAGRGHLQAAGRRQRTACPRHLR